MQAQEEVIFIRGKRSKRPITRAPSPLSLSMAATSSSTTGTGFSGGGVIVSDTSAGACDRVTLDDRSSPPSDSSDDQLTRRRDEEEEYMANCLMLLAGGRTQKPPQAAAVAAVVAEVYQCKTCSKSFSSFQALGGHRASHKRPIKPPTLDHEIKKPPLKHRHQEISSPSKGGSDGGDSSIILSLQFPSRSPSFSGNKTIRVHECSICGAEFASGQALGGHMRRHRPIPTVTAASDSSHGGESREVKRPRNLLSLDLNLPAPEDHEHRDSKFPFASKEQVIVFSTSPMVDCHY